MIDNKIESFTDLDAWQKAHKLALLVYRITDNFPSTENFSLTNQMRRCSISITSNIAEGFSRQTNKEKIQLYSIAKGSLTELQNLLILSRDLKYISKEKFNDIAKHTIEVAKLINGLIRYLK